VGRERTTGERRIDGRLRAVDLKLGACLPLGQGPDLHKEDIRHDELRSESLHVGFRLDHDSPVVRQKSRIDLAPRFRIEAIAKFGIFGVADVERKGEPNRSLSLEAAKLGWPGVTASAEFIVLLLRRSAVEAGEPAIGSVFSVILQSPEDSAAAAAIGDNGG
jgi:hypothetical protein